MLWIYIVIVLTYGYIQVQSYKMVDQLVQAHTHTELMPTLYCSAQGGREAVRRILQDGDAEQ